MTDQTIAIAPATEQARLAEQAPALRAATQAYRKQRQRLSRA